MPVLMNTPSCKVAVMHAPKLLWRLWLKPGLHAPPKTWYHMGTSPIVQRDKLLWQHMHMLGVSVHQAHWLTCTFAMTQVQKLLIQSYTCQTMPVCCCSSFIILLCWALIAACAPNVKTPRARLSNLCCRVTGCVGARATGWCAAALLLPSQG